MAFVSSRCPALHSSEGAVPSATDYTDEARAYQGLPFTHEAVKYSVDEYVRVQASTNGMASFRALVEHGYNAPLRKRATR